MGLVNAILRRYSQEDEGEEVHYGLIGNLN